MFQVSDAIKSPTFILKIVELVISILSVGLITDVGGVALDVNKLAVVYGTLVGFIMISIIIIIGCVIENPMPRTLILVLTPPAAILFLASGGIMIESYATWDFVSGRVLGSGIVALANGVVYIIDFVVTFFKYS